MSDVAKLQDYIKASNESVENPSAATTFYMDTFKANEGVTRFASWNWCAFLFGAGWLFYRKMYFYAFLAFVIETINFINALLTKDNSVWFYSYVALLGLFGNALYKNDLNKRVALKRSQYGTSVFLACVYAAYVVLWVVILAVKEMHQS